MNLYVHFPFCRVRCAYCSLHSRTGTAPADRDAYVRKLVDELAARRELSSLTTVYFGGGSPAWCDLSPLLRALKPRLGGDCEFSVELHPLEVTDAKILQLREGGVNRISMGVQSFDDRVLTAMGRGYSAGAAISAFRKLRQAFDNVGIDLIVGLPGDGLAGWHDWLSRFGALGLRHCSVYSLQNERRLQNVPDDDALLDDVRTAASMLADLGLRRYEISNYAVEGYECRHNLSVWRGEDYVGLGEGACGREGLVRTRGIRRGDALAYERETVDAAFDRRERALFRLRIREGLDAADFAEWQPTLARLAAERLLTRITDTAYRLTGRGTEIADAIMAEIVASP